MSNFHVYIDYKPNGVPFYVGKGNSSRVNLIERNEWHTNVRKKYPDWYRVIVETASEEKCYEFEEFLIEEIGRRDLGKGPLVNLKDGGKSGSNYSDEICKKISIALTGVPHEPERVERMRRSRKGKGLWPNDRREQFGKHISTLYQNPEYTLAASNRAKEFQSSDTYRENMSVVVSKAWSDPELRANQSKKVSATKWYTDGVKSVRIVESQIEDYVNAGWRPGRAPKKRDLD